MALVLKDRVQETGTGNTTVSFTLSGAVAGYQSFSAIGNTNTTYYAATDASNNWEAGLGTYSTTGPTLTRTTILSSSNSGAAVTFSGTVNVFCTYPSSRSLYLDETSAGVNVSQAAFTSGGAVYATSTTALTSGTLPLTAGGTNATSSIGALTSLGAAARGTNTDITSIALTTGTITTAASGNNDIVNKSYLDSQIFGINYHQPVNYATASALPANTSNGIGVGGTLTANANGALTVDGNLVLAGQRILVKDESLQAKNGVYTVTQPGTGSTPYILTRAIDYDTSGSGTNEVDAGDFILAISGTVNANTAWVQQTALPITVGTTPLSFLLFNAYLAGTGLSLTTSQPTTFSIANTAVTAGSYGSSTTIPTYTVNAQGQLTSATDVAIGTLNQNTTGNAATATSAGKSTNIAGGAAGSIPYQTALDSTSFLTAGTSGFVLTQGASAPVWSNSLTLTGNISATALIPTGSTIPTRGLYAPSATTVALASNSANALYIDAGQNIAIGSSSPSYKLDVNGAVRASGGFVIATQSQTSPSPSLSVNSNNIGEYVITALANDFTISADSASPANGSKLIFRITTSSGTARTITFTGGTAGGFRPVGVTMTLSGSNYTYTTPAAAAAKTVYFGCIYNTEVNYWDIVALAQET